MSKVDKNKELYEKTIERMKTKYESGNSFGRLPDGCRV